MRRLALTSLALVIGLAAIIWGVYTGIQSHTVIYKKTGPGIIAHYISSSQPGTGYLQLLTGPSLYIVPETAFTPRVNGINTFADGDMVSLVYDSVHPTTINVQSNMGNHLTGNAYNVAEITFYSGSKQVIYKTQPYKLFPKGYYQNDWYTGGAATGAGMLVLGSIFFILRYKPRRATSQSPTMSDQIAEEVSLSTANLYVIQDQQQLDQLLQASPEAQRTGHFELLLNSPEQPTGPVTAAPQAPSQQPADPLANPFAPATPSQMGSGQFRSAPTSLTGTSQFKIPLPGTPPGSSSGQFSRLPPLSPGQASLSGQFKLPASQPAPEFPTEQFLPPPSSQPGQFMPPRPVLPLKSNTGQFVPPVANPPTESGSGQFKPPTSGTGSQFQALKRKLPEQTEPSR